MKDCAICLRETTKLVALSCLHSFCEDCISCWLAISNKCPLCTQIVSENKCEKEYQAEQIPPCIDYSHELSFVQKRLDEVRRRVDIKYASSQNLKSNVSKAEGLAYLRQYKQAQQFFTLLSTLIVQNSQNQQIVFMMQTVNFKLLEIENMLQTGAMNNHNEQYYQQYDESQDEQFLQMQHRMKKNCNRKSNREPKGKIKTNIK